MRFTLDLTSFMVRLYLPEIISIGHCSHLESDNAVVMYCYNMIGSVPWIPVIFRELFSRKLYFVVFFVSVWNATCILASIVLSDLFLFLIIN